MSKSCKWCSSGRAPRASASGWHRLGIGAQPSGCRNVRGSDSSGLFGRVESLEMLQPEVCAPGVAPWRCVASWLSHAAAPSARDSGVESGPASDPPALAWLEGRIGVALLALCWSLVGALRWLWGRIEVALGWLPPG